MIAARRLLSSRRGPHRQRAFTLLELLLGLSLLVAMMALIYGALRMGSRAWDAADARVTEAAHWRVVEQFMRRELSQVFPARWRGATVAQIAFEGTKTDLKYVTGQNLDAGVKIGGFSWALLQLVDAPNPDPNSTARTYALQVNRQSFDLQAKDWSGLTDPPRDATNVVPPSRLVDGILTMELSYFGAENDTATPAWVDSWNLPNRLPQLVRMKFETLKGREIPELVFSLNIGEEAGCLEQSFVRNCGARPR